MTSPKGVKGRNVSHFHNFQNAPPMYYVTHAYASSRHFLQILSV